MIRGLYTAATGMDAGLRRQDAISHNLANVGTAGFKREQVLFQSMLAREIYRYSSSAPPAYLGLIGAGVNYTLGAPDMSAGMPLRTDSPLDIALIDSGQATTFLAVEDAQGQRAYTRNAQMLVDGNGYLRTIAGAYVLGRTWAGGAERLRVSNPDELRIATDGTLSVGGARLGQLYLVNPAADATLTRRGDSLWQIDGQVQAVADPHVEQGYIEQANVQVVKEMVNLIAAMRNYETHAKIIQIQDETLNKAVNEAGRV